MVSVRHDTEKVTGRSGFPKMSRTKGANVAPAATERCSNSTGFAGENRELPEDVLKGTCLNSSNASQTMAHANDSAFSQKARPG